MLHCAHIREGGIGQQREQHGIGINKVEGVDITCHTNIRAIKKHRPGNPIIVDDIFICDTGQVTNGY
jgi:hypothetical protein